ncbi:MAG: hypothetical protein ABUT20_11115 [Bacteroidota bacterium]
MKNILFLTLISVSLTSFSQIPKSGTYFYKYCDLEYENSCYGTCKVIIKGNYITIYATKNLAERRTFTKEGDIIDKGIILKHTSGKWIVGKTLKDKYAKEIGIEGPAILDFKKRQYWTF